MIQEDILTDEDKLLRTGKRKYLRLSNLSVFFHFYAQDEQWLLSDSLYDLDKKRKDHFMKLFKKVIHNPQDSALYDLLLKLDGEKQALREIERNGLLALALLGDISILPQLVDCLLDQRQKGTTGNRDFSTRVALEIDFALRFLIGQNLHYLEYGHWNELWQYNQLTLKRLPLETRFILEDLSQWSFVLANARKIAESQPGFEDDLRPVWNELEESIPRLEFEPLWYYPIINRRLSLEEWLEDLLTNFEGDLFGKPKSFFSLPVSIQNEKVWASSSYSWSIRLQYWKGLFVKFVEWSELSQAVLQSIEWKVDANLVKMITRWHAPIQSFEELAVLKTEKSFGSIVFRPEFSTNKAKISNALLLNIQLLVQRIGAQIRFVDCHNGRLTLELPIPKAHNNTIFSVYAQPSGAIEEIVGYILSSIMPPYTQASLKVERLLLNNMVREELIWLREAFSRF